MEPLTQLVVDVSGALVPEKRSEETQALCWSQDRLFEPAPAQIPGQRALPDE